MKLKNLILAMVLVAIFLSSSSLFCQEEEFIIGFFVGDELNDVGTDLSEKIERCINKIIQESANKKGEINDDAVNNIVDKIVNLFEEIFGSGDFTKGELYKSLSEDLRKIYKFAKEFKNKNGDVGEEEIGDFTQLINNLRPLSPLEIILIFFVLIICFLAFICFMCFLLLR